MNDAVTALLLWVGAAFLLLGGFGILRLPDTFTRMQAATKAVTLGVSCMMLAAMTHFWQAGVTLRAIATIVFLFATAPVAAHLIGRVAYLVGAQMWSGTQFDDLRQHYQRRSSRGTAPPRGEGGEGPASDGRPGSIGRM